MAKISELVKTFKLLSDPNAPDWNVKFVGGVVVALAIVAAAGALVWSAGSADPPATEGAPAAATLDPPPPGDVTTCDPTEVAEEMTRRGGALPKGHVLASGCVIG